MSNTTKLIIVAIAATMICSFIVSVQADETAAPKAQTVCPVMGGQVDAHSLYVDYEGKRIYVCCAGCVDSVKKDPEKYIKMLEENGVTVATVPTKHKDIEKHEGNMKSDSHEGHHNH